MPSSIAFVLYFVGFCISSRFFKAVCTGYCWICRRLRAFDGSDTLNKSYPSGSLLLWWILLPIIYTSNYYWNSLHFSAKLNSSLSFENKLDSFLYFYFLIMWVSRNVLIKSAILNLSVFATQLCTSALFAPLFQLLVLTYFSVSIFSLSHIRSIGKA